MKEYTKKVLRSSFFPIISSKNKLDYVQKLASMGIAINQSQIILSSDVAIKYLKGMILKGILSGTATMKNYLSMSGISFSEDNPEFILLGYDTEINYEKISKASILINSGLPYFATHDDKYCPTMEGPVPDAGSFVELFKLTTRPRTYGI